MLIDADAVHPAHLLYSIFGIFFIHIVYPQLNVPLTNSANISHHMIIGDPTNMKGKLAFLDNVQNIPNFPVLWIDLGADVESVRRQRTKVKIKKKIAGPGPRGEADFRAGDSDEAP